MPFPYSFLPNKELTHFKSKGLVLLKFTVTTACLYFLYDVVQNKMDDGWYSPPLNFTNIFKIAMVLIIMPLNWYLEIVKWQVIVNNRFLAAFRQVLLGVVLNWLIPFTVGDIIARTGSFQNLKERTKAIFVTRISSLLITVYYGVGGLLYYFLVVKQEMIMHHAIYYIYLFVPVMSLFFLKHLAGQIATLSMLRYLIFSFQFLVLLTIFLPDISLIVLMFGVFWIFLFRSVVPSFLGALGLREFSAVLFFSPLVSNLLLVITPSLLIWFINLVIPTLIGAVMVNISNYDNKA